MLLAVGFGRWAEKHHPAILLGLGLAVAAGASFALVVAEPIPAIALATTGLGIGHMSGTIGAQSIMAQAHSSLSRINRFGTLTTVSALGQIVGPVLGGVIIGHSEQPSVESTSTALLVAAFVFVAGVPPALPGVAHQNSEVDRANWPRRTGVAPAAQARDARCAEHQFLREKRHRPPSGVRTTARRGGRAHVRRKSACCSASVPPAPCWPGRRHRSSSGGCRR